MPRVYSTNGSPKPTDLIHVGCWCAQGVHRVCSPNGSSKPSDLIFDAGVSRVFSPNGSAKPSPQQQPSFAMGQVPPLNGGDPLR